MPLTADQIEENFGKLERNIVGVENTIMVEINAIKAKMEGNSALEIDAIKTRLDKLEGRSEQKKEKQSDVGGKT